MFRKRRQPTPHFGLPPPYQPMTGERAPLQRPVDKTRVAMMQVLEEHDDYLVCRGYDPEHFVFLDEVSVAKPLVLQKTPWHGKTYAGLLGDDVEAEFTYDVEEGVISSSRTVVYGEGESAIVTAQEISYPYFIGDMLACVKPEMRLGETQGTPDADEYTEGMEILNVVTAIKYDDNAKPIHWLDLNVAGRGWNNATDVRFEMTAALTLGGSASVKRKVWDGDSYEDTTVLLGSAITVYDFQKKHSKPATTSGADGALGIARYWPDRGAWEIVSMSVPMHFKALAKGAVDSGDGTYIVDNLVPLYGCYSWAVDSAEEVTVQNTFSDDIDDNGRVTLSWNATNNQVETDDVKCAS